MVVTSEALNHHALFLCKNCIVIITVRRYTMFPKNDTPSACYNFDVCQLVLIIFGKNVTNRQERRQWNCDLFLHFTQVMFLHYLTKQGNTKITSFHTNVVLLLFHSSTVAARFFQFCWSICVIYVIYVAVWFEQIMSGGRWRCTFRK